MPTDIVQTSTRARNFALRFGAWSLGLFGLLRLNGVEAYGVLPVTRLQGQLATRLSGLSALPVDVTLACSATDVLALCVGAILAYPAQWRRRLAGAGVGVALIVALNTIRIATLGRAAGSPSWFALLHLYVWPALLTLAVAGYVFAWMRFADTRRAVVAAVVAPTLPRVSPSFVGGRFVWLTGVFLVLFAAASPLYLESARVLAVAAVIARTAAWALGVLGVQAMATGNVLSTARGGFLVTQECLATPLIPVYFAAVFAASITWRRRAPALLAAVPLFAGLAVARLLVVALPVALVGSPTFLVHAFYQLLLAAVVVGLAAFWRHGAGAAAWRRAVLGVALGGVLVCLLGPPYMRALTSAFGAGPLLEDPQGALALLPAFQVGLYVALTVAAFVAITWRPFVTGLALLGLSQIAIFAVLDLLARHAGLTPHVRDVRAWAIAGPLLIVAGIVRYDRPRR